MERIWNYFFYSFWCLEVNFGEILIRRPIFFIMLKLFPSLSKNAKKGEKEYQKIMNSKDSGFNVGFAFGFMFLMTMIIYSCICLWVVKLQNIQIGYLLYYFVAVIVLSYLTNYFLLYQSDKYKRYFHEFEKKSSKRLSYLTAVLFSLCIAGMGLLSIYYTVGFNL